MEPDWDTLLMEAYDRWCENEYDTDPEDDPYDPEDWAC